jgi:hypothetical protein
LVIGTTWLRRCATAQCSAELLGEVPALAEAVGLTGLWVEGPVQVRPALEQALASAGPILVDLVSDPNVLSLLQKATIQQAEGLALAMTKMVFTGELNDVMDTVAVNWRYLRPPRRTPPQNLNSVQSNSARKPKSRAC